MNPKRIGSLLVVAAVGLSLTACSGVKPPVNEKYLYFKNGTGDSRTFQECVNGGTTGDWQADNDVFTVSTALRNWNILEKGGDSDVPIVSGSKPGKDPVTGADMQSGPQVKVYLTADFYLNTDCGVDGSGKVPDPKDPKKQIDAPLIQFWNKTGSRFEISDADGTFRKDKWIEMLQNTLVPAENRGVQDGTRFYTADELDNNLNGAWGKLEKQMAPSFQQILNEKVGGSYFCGPGYAGGEIVTWKEPVVREDGTFTEKDTSGACPPVKITIDHIDFFDTDVAKNRAAVYAAQLRAQAALIDAQSQVNVANELKKAGDPAILIRIKELETQLGIAQKQLESAQACASNPNCMVVVGVNSVQVSNK